MDEETRKALELSREDLARMAINGEPADVRRDSPHEHGKWNTWQSVTIGGRTIPDFRSCPGCGLVEPLP